MRKIIPILLSLVLISIVIATNHSPPAYNFQQFYGSVSGISAAGFKVRAQIGTTQFETPIAANGQYGYSPTFKVQGQNGNTINFFIVNPSGSAAAVGTPTTYVNLASTRLDFTYSNLPAGGANDGSPSGGNTGGQSGPPAQCGNNIREGAEFCDGTDLAGQSCASQVGVGSTGALNCTSSCTFNTTICTASTGTCWICNDWGRCRNNLETRTCARADCTEAGALRSDPADERSCGNVSRTSSSSSSSSTCTMSWECSAWSLCRSSQQSRICFRADNCDTLLAQRQITSITSAIKPNEQKSCQEAAGTTVQAVCDSGMKRCLGPQLQLCSTDGLQWATLQTCPNSCDPISLTCRAESAAPPQSPQKPSSSLWVYLLVGSIVLVLVIVSISMALLNKKKYAPAKEYIEENRTRGIDDEQIREKLVDEGWDEKAVGKLFR